MQRAIWIWGTLDALTGALWSGPTAAFLSAFAVELGAGGGQLGLLLALNTLLANGLQLQGAQWTRRGHTSRRVYVAAVLARGSWLFAGAAPAALALAGRRGTALLVFLATLILSAVATAAASPAMAARASSAASQHGRTRYLADRMMATWLGALLGTAGMTALLALRPGPAGYALGFAVAGTVGLLGLGAYTALLRVAAPADQPPRAVLAPADEPVGAPASAGEDPGKAGLEELGDQEQAALAAASVSITPATTPAARRTGVQPRFGVEAAGQRVTGQLPPGAAQPAAGWWRVLARRLGAPEAPALGQLVLAAAILQGGAAMIGPAAPIWLVRYLGAPSSFLGTVSLASSLAAIASQRLWARWIDRSGSDRVLSFAGAAAAAIPLGWLLVWHPWIALPLSAYGGLAWGGYSLAMTSRLLQLAPPAERAAYLGTYATAVGAAGAAGSLIAGAITAAVPVPWIPVVFLLSFGVRGFGWLTFLRAAPR